MKILADENIAQLAACFGWAGELVTLPGRAIDAAALRDVDALLVRSITRVDAGLLADSPCRFVGTATSGIDHVDTAFLQQKGIGFGWAQGCNANSVVEYVFSVLASLSEQHQFDWRQNTYGIIGCGQIGGLLASKLQALQIPFVIHDPFLDAEHPLAAYFADLDEVLNQDVLTFHTPLTRNSAWPTWHLLDKGRLARLKPATILINAARGAVVDNQALLENLKRHPRRLAVLDAWEGEPDISHELLQRVAIATPHIAGYSREGKLNGTSMIAASFRAHFGLEAPVSAGLAETTAGIQLFAERSLFPLAQLNRLILQAYAVMRDHVAMQQLLTAQKPAVLFDRLRKEYPVRREFSHFSVQASELLPEIVPVVQALGFRLLP